MMKCKATLGFQDESSGEDIRCTLERGHAGNHEDFDHYRGDGMHPNWEQTKFSFHRNAMMLEAVMVGADPNARPCHVFCAVPGGEPWMTFDPKSSMSTPVRNAGTFDNLETFRAFILERFADSAS